MRAELEAGASYVIAEARETGNVGIYRGSGEVREGLVQEILHKFQAKRFYGKLHKSTTTLLLELLGCKM